MNHGKLYEIKLEKNKGNHEKNEKNYFSSNTKNASLRQQTRDVMIENVTEEKR